MAEQPAAMTPESIAAMAPAHWGFGFTKTIHKTPAANIDPKKASLPDGAVVLVTGAGKGLGEYIARAYAEAGASNIIITARTAKDLDRVKAECEKIASGSGKKINVETVPGDATKPQSYAELKKLLETTYNGRLDYLVCNAGGGDTLDSLWGKIAEDDVKTYTEITTLNYLSAYYAANALIPLMLNPQSVGKTLINITSGAAHLVSLSPLAYNIAKHALNRLTEAIDEQYKDQGLISIAVHPGSVLTPGADNLPDWLKGIATDDIRLCGNVCVWFSKEKRQWASGRYIAAAWDVDELEAKKDDIVKEDKLKFRMVV